MKSPVALFIYNRPDKVRKTIEKALQSNGAENRFWYVFQDGPFENEDIVKVEKCSEIAESLLKNIPHNIVKSNINQGLKQSIISGVSSVLRENDSLIVLEDDILVADVFFDSMDHLLEEFKHHSEVMHINGYTNIVEEECNYTLLFDMTCWGWATWADRWKYFESNPDRILMRLIEIGFKEFPYLHKYLDRYHQLLTNHYHLNETWAILWQYSILLNGGCCVGISRSLTTNIGNDGSGEHKFEFNEIQKIGVFNYDIKNDLKIVDCRTFLKESDLKVISDFQKMFLLSIQFSRKNLLKMLLRCKAFHFFKIWNLRNKKSRFVLKEKDASLELYDAVQEINYYRRFKISNLFATMLDYKVTEENFNSQDYRLKEYLLKSTFANEKILVTYDFGDRNCKTVIEQVLIAKSSAILLVVNLNDRNLRYLEELKINLKDQGYSWQEEDFYPQDLRIKEVYRRNILDVLAIKNR